MKTILCFGDSNTWGVVPQENRRYNKSERWPCLLGSYLPEEWRIVEEGMPGRTTLYDDPASGFSSGLQALKQTLKSYLPDLVVIMLGTNDLKASFGLSSSDISHSVAKLVEEASGFHGEDKQISPKILLVAPPAIHENGSFAQLFFTGAEEKSKEFAKHYRERAEEQGCDFFDAGQVVQTCPEEGVHWLAEQHQNMAKAIAPKVLEILKQYT